jgi:hypothetical protein
VKSKILFYMIMISVVSSAVLSACGPAKTPADSIVDYLEALAVNDQAGVVSNSCVSWEEKALAEVASYANVEVTLENLECQVLDQGDAESTVTCSGKFISSYTAGEDQELDLSALIFSAILEEGQWRMCGYIW